MIATRGEQKVFRKANNKSSTPRQGFGTASFESEYT